MDEIVKKARRKKYTAEEKWRIFIETSAPGSPVGEILRKYGLYPGDLTKIRQQVEKGAKEELGRNKYRKIPLHVDYEEHQKIKEELTAKEKALAEMGQEYLLLKKKVNLE
jgi:transposase-like protein